MGGTAGEEIKSIRGGDSDTLAAITGSIAGAAYGIPFFHWYCEEDGKIYFHRAKTGHKIDIISKCDKVSLCVYDWKVGE